MADELLDEVQQVRDQAQLVHDAAVVDNAIDRLAAQITEDYRQLNPLLLFALKGGCYLGSRLMDKLDFALQIEMVQLSRYQDQLTGGQLETGITPATPFADRHLLIVDDILDQGVTLAGLVGFCHAGQAATVGSVVLIDKQCSRPTDINADYVGLTAPDRYLFGCGMDYKGYWRNLPAIYALAEPGQR